MAGNSCEWTRITDQVRKSLDEFILLPVYCVSKINMPRDMSLKNVMRLSRLPIDNQIHLTECVHKRVAKDLTHLRACAVVLQLLPEFDLTARSVLFLFAKRSSNAIRLSLYGWEAGVPAVFPVC